MPISRKGGIRKKKGCFFHRLFRKNNVFLYLGVVKILKLMGMYGDPSKGFSKLNNTI
ncbi:hypothetical protein IKS_05963 [Bacillus cereus VDM062]|nr:hypothetical protein IKS_05963 [Bacillus cereus VDM062]